MILKSKDSLETTLRQMEQRLQGGLPDFERRKVEKQLAQMRSGIRGEKEAAYHIDFYLKDHSRWTVIHDLRIEWKDRVAQIDHLVVGCCLDAYVVESKNYATKVRYANGGWERLVFNHWEGIPSPVEQNERHIFVLKRLIKECGMAPTRLGLPLALKFFNVVLVAPTCSIVGKFPRNKNVLICRMDEFTERIDKTAASALSLLKMVSPESLQALGAKLATWHAPKEATVSKMPITDRSPAPKNSGSRCESCGGAVTAAEAFFCRMNKDRFAGKSLCQKCQKFAPQAVQSNGAGVCCAQCGTKVDARVAKYCACNSDLFGNEVLCRKCQDLVKRAA